MRLEINMIVSDAKEAAKNVVFTDKLNHLWVVNQNY